ncbi:MAG: transferrin-binding protein-like solute binding protein [Sphingomonadaceae bacterium]
MRKPLLLVSLTALAACSGGGPQTAGGTAVVGGGSGTGTNNSNSSSHTFENPTEAKTYSAIGGIHSYSYSTDERTAAGQYNQLYAGNASTARNSGITVAYDPRDAIFEITIADAAAAGVDQTLRFQDPVHRTDFGGAEEPQGGTPDIPGKSIHYLEAGSGTGQLRYDLTQSDTFPVGEADGSRDVSTFFYQKPGTTTKYVTYAGFLRNRTAIVEITNPDSSKYLRQDHVLDRAAFVFGERTSNSNVPTSGTATYTGDMLATMVYNPLIDTQADAPTYFQWITGSASTNIDFGANTFTSTMTGTVTAPNYDVYTSRTHVLDAGAGFSASGSGTIDLVNKGGFAGQMGSAGFTQGGASIPVTIAGSSIDGAFYGPNAQEVGGGFRIVGGTPDERIDILGSFVGTKP